MGFNGTWEDKDGDDDDDDDDMLLLLSDLRAALFGFVLSFVSAEIILCAFGSSVGVNLNWSVYLPALLAS